MTRRWALAASLVLTVFVGFFVLTYGTNAGVFAWGGSGSATQAPTFIGTTPADQLPADAPAAVPPAGAELVNIDSTSLQPSDQPADASGHDREGDERDHEDHDRGEGEHEDDD